MFSVEGVADDFAIEYLFLFQFLSYSVFEFSDIDRVDVSIFKESTNESVSSQSDVEEMNDFR